MALRFIDSFDHYATTGSGTDGKWTTSRNGAVSLTTGRFGNGWSGNGSRWSMKEIDSQATWIIGGAVMNPPGETIWGVLDAGSYQCDVRFDGTNTLSVTRNGTSLGTATWVPTSNVFYYIEFKVTVDDSAGVAIVKIDGTTLINLSSVDTKNTANATANQIRVGSRADNASAMVIDDFYICDGTGSSPTNTFLGDVRVQALYPNGNGNSSQLVGSDGNSTDNYLLVDETTPNDDTDYVESSTVGDKDTYAYTNLTPTTGTVYGVQCIPRARKTDAGVRSIASVARVSSTEVDSADKALATSYQFLPDVRETKPGGGSWSISDVNSAEFGVKVTA